MELIKLGESHGIPVMRRFFWEVLRFVAFWEIVKRIIGHADDSFMLHGSPPGVVWIVGSLNEFPGHFLISLLLWLL